MSTNPTYKNGFFTSAPSPEAYLGDLKADGTVPLTADWNVGEFAISTTKCLNSCTSSYLLASVQGDNSVSNQTGTKIISGHFYTMSVAGFVGYTSSVVNMFGIDTCAVLQSGHASTATCTNAYGVRSFAGTTADGNPTLLSLTNAYAFYASNGSYWGNISNHIDNQYQIYVEKPTHGLLKNYAIYSAGGDIYNADAAVTPGTGTGLTVNQAGTINRQVYKVTTTYLAYETTPNSLTQDLVIATLPAKTKIVSIYADTTVAYTGGGVTAATICVGKSAGGTEYIATHDVFAGATTKGLADADMGTEMARAAKIQDGSVVNWTTTIPVTVRLTTTTAHTDDLTDGSTTFYIVTERY